MPADNLEMNGDADRNGETEVRQRVPLRGHSRRQQSPLNMNHYANKKSAAESMLDVALLMANASQLKAVLEQGPDFTFYVPLITLISISLILQILVGILLIFIGEAAHFLFGIKGIFRCEINFGSNTQ
ncbi:ninjurin-1 [Xyrichtys novacula]|uniref:Ninjurin-1 n=1 Tax=Xyrichtys novacula TaxID=13765 RepID=A0AAV1EPP8_XYRNO|nr:ninjurin-1 [Xyrichtys novacula]